MINRVVNFLKKSNNKVYTWWALHEIPKARLMNE